MGKKSKRRGGTGGGKKSRQAAGAGGIDGSSGSILDQTIAAAASGVTGPTVTPAEALALLETVPPPPSLKGIISTNDDPGKCALCLSPAALVVPYGVLGVAFSNLSQLCCGKRFCKACERDTNCGYALDLLGETRCTFCNALRSRSTSLYLQEATARKPWAQYCMGIHWCAGDSPSRAFDYLVKAASQGYPEAFLMLSQLCQGEYGHPPDLMSAKIYAEKARSFHPDLRLISNKVLVKIAEKYFEDGAVEEVMGILSDIAKEADPDALDGDLCEWVAAFADRIDEYQLASEMCVRAFCFGQVQSALRTSDCYFVMEHFALSKLWLSVACKTSSGFRCFKKMADGTFESTAWSRFKELRDEIRAKLREISDSCGGCGAALEGDTRQYCRGCKAFCYCSRECQKQHWNRTDGGHRAECKEAQDQACKILEAIQSGKIDLSKNKE